MKRRALYLIVGFGLVFLLTSCAINVEPEKINNDNKPTDQNNETDQKVLAIDAYHIFTDKYPEAKVVKFQLHKDNGRYYYKLKAFGGDNEYEMKIDYTTGNIIKDEMEREHNNSDLSITKDDVNKAVNIVEMAIKDLGEDAVLSEYSLEAENNKLVVEVEIDYDNGLDSEITYELATGDIIKIDD